MTRQSTITAALLCITLSSGCATLAGSLTGALTGMVDAPAQVYRQNRESFTKHPTFWPANILIVGPLGFVGGEVVGFWKGMTLDIEFLLGNIGLNDVFGSYDEASIWRPYTLSWPSAQEEHRAAERPAREQKSEPLPESKPSSSGTDS